MANEFGDAWRIHIKTEENEFTAIGGETGFDWRRTSQELDISDKDSGVYGATSYNNQRINFAVSGNVKLPDEGLLAVVTASKASPPQVELQVRKGAVIKFHGLMAIGNMSTSHQKQGPVTYSFDAANAAAPIVDNLGATA